MANCLFFNLTNNLKISLVHVKLYLLLLRFLFLNVGRVWYSLVHLVQFLYHFKVSPGAELGWIVVLSLRKLCGNNAGALHRLSCVKVQAKGVLWAGPWLKHAGCTLGCSAVLPCWGLCFFLIKEGRFCEALLRIMLNYFSRANVLPSFLLFLW